MSLATIDECTYQEDEMLKFTWLWVPVFTLSLLPATLTAHEGKTTFVMTEMANYHAAFVSNVSARIDTTKLVKILRAGGDSKTEKEIFAAALPLAERLGSASSAKERLDLYAELSEKLAPLHGFHDQSNTSVFYCPMLKKKWIARGSEISNPYRADMRSCGARN